MRSTEHRFEGAGTAFFLVVTTGTGRGVVLALPDLRWAYSVSAHEAPSAAYLASVGLRRADAAVLAAYLTPRWADLVDDVPMPTLLVLRGEGPKGKSLLADTIQRAAGSTVRVMSVGHPSEWLVGPLAYLQFPAGRKLVIATTNGTLPSSAEAELAKHARVHVASLRTPLALRRPME